MKFIPQGSSFRNIAVLFLLLLSSCLQKNNPVHDKLKKQLQVTDSLIIAGKGDSAIQLLTKLRKQIPGSDPLICTYYNQQAEHYFYKPAVMNLYADSSLFFFSNPENIEKYPDEYFHSLLIKGDACFKTKNFAKALDYYYKGQKVLSSGICDNGELAGKIGIIYFTQKNYLVAAKYWAESYNKLGLCNENITAQKLFFIKQGTLNNTGFSYERAGKLDSATVYYLKDLNLITKTDSNKLIGKHYINTAGVVVYDNLGGVNLKQGNLRIAESYLTKSVALVGDDLDGAIVPPLLKLAELYIKLDDNLKAKQSFDKSRQVLDHLPVDNEEEYEIKWNKLYAQYLYKINQPGAAYHYQDIYIKLKDAFDTRSANLYSLNVEQELHSLQQKQALTNLEQENKVKKIYLASSVIFVIFSLALIFIINKNLKKAKERQTEINQQNQHLQRTLDELEHVNKNYIRIMRVMAHDLRNPISGITGLVSLMLAEDEFSEENRTILKLIETTGLNSMKMINELLNSGLADENEKLVTQKIDLNALLYDSVELLQFKAQEKQQTIIFKHINTPIIAEVNHEKIWRAINNLIVNAIKFSHISGIIRVGIQSENKRILISVADNGIGIPPDQKDSVFEMFTPAKKNGTDGEQPFGLGLSISKKIVEMHNGNIWFESNAGNGTIFYIELPALD